MTREQAANEHVRISSIEFGDATPAAEALASMSFLAGYDAANEWVKVEDGCEMPENNENVLVIHNGYLGVMAWGCVDDGEYGGYVWSNCYGDVSGEPQYDDEYKPSHWKHLPPVPVK